MGHRSCSYTGRTYELLSGQADVAKVPALEAILDEFAPSGHDHLILMHHPTLDDKIDVHSDDMTDLDPDADIHLVMGGPLARRFQILTPDATTKDSELSTAKVLFDDILLPGTVVTMTAEANRRCKHAKPAMTPHQRDTFCKECGIETPDTDDSTSIVIRKSIKTVPCAEVIKRVNDKRQADQQRKTKTTTTTNFPVPTLQPEKEEGIVVLSLFDGNSGAQVALERDGIAVGTCCSSEVDPNCIEVAQRHCKNTEQLGNVTEITEATIARLKKIDLVVGGSPCQGLSKGGNHRGLEDDRSALFFDHSRILAIVRKHNPDVRWLLENVAPPDKDRDQMNAALADANGGTFSTVRINSALVSAQSRKRLYFTNISGVKKPEDRGVSLGSILEDQQPSLATITSPKKPVRAGVTKSSPKDSAPCRVFSPTGKAPTATTTGTPKVLVKGQPGATKQTVLDADQCRHCTMVAVERLQTFPDDCTVGFTDNERLQMLGNSFTVDVIAHILGHMPRQQLKPKPEDTPIKPKPRFGLNGIPVDPNQSNARAAVRTPSAPPLWRSTLAASPPATRPTTRSPRSSGTGSSTSRRARSRSTSTPSSATSAPPSTSRHPLRRRSLG